MKTAALLTIVLAACASGPPDPAEVAAREYRRANARIEAIERFRERSRRCAERGGVMHIARSTSGHFPPTTTELRLATCRQRVGGYRF